MGTRTKIKREEFVVYVPAGMDVSEEEIIERARDQVSKDQSVPVKHCLVYGHPLWDGSGYKVTIVILDL
ncbi:hypothetical protein A2706_02935 [Candidatus Peribacteria bacterium RIFCSPHIGHO2_01_FULL_51_35]|nr:MAG: hypothetical protein A2706_02935 [Candidatus Peribacteria bacterium RIFCSPHIGHO2_01_FULL_51_35]